MYQKFGKRCIDLIFSLIGIIILIPFFVLIVCAIRIDSRGPIIFKQRRVGIHKKHFNILKFRTMKIDTPSDTPTHLLGNPHQYITNVGRVLRKTSLDELPQLMNICLGHMSIVGPRPALWNQYDLLEEREKYGANDVRPGLTGLAQINGRDELSIELKAKLDGEYVEKLGFKMDMYCLFRTIKSVIKREGIIEGGERLGEIERHKTKESVTID